MRHMVQSSPPTGWFNSSKSAKKVSLRFVTLIIDGLKKLYVHKLKHLEVNYRVNDFVSPLLSNSGFDAKPMVMLLAQYSTGKTTFIKHLLRTSYPVQLANTYGYFRWLTKECYKEKNIYMVGRNFDVMVVFSEKYACI